MATLEELAEKYTLKLLESNDAQEIITGINQLTYSKSDEKISFEDKRKIVALIQEKSLDKKQLRTKDGYVICGESINNEEYLRLIEFILKGVSND